MHFTKRKSLLGEKVVEIGMAPECCSARDCHRNRHCSGRTSRKEHLLLARTLRSDVPEKEGDGEKVHTRSPRDKLVASNEGGPGLVGGVPLSPNESKTRFGRRGRASIAATSSRACFRMSLTDLADSISFAVIRPGHICEL